jgi:hypothetical protein
MTPICVIVPQLVEAAGNSTAPLFDAVSPVTVNVTAVRAYDPPLISVPAPDSPGSSVNKATYHVVGRVALPVVRSHVKTVVSKVFVKDTVSPSG